MQTMITAESPEFKSWLEKTAAIAEDYRRTNFPSLGPVTFVAEDGQKFIRVVRCDGQRSVHCFIAKVDSETKGLGKIRAGDVLKSASWKVPAKHARGNIFDADGGVSQMTPYGPQSR